MSFMQNSARHFLTIRAAREIRQEIEKAGVDALRTLANAGSSIVGTYLNGCNAQEKARHKRDLNVLLQMGVTPDMLLEEVIRQMPEIAPEFEGKERYKKAELEKLVEFLKE